jgi:beta-lactamase regulating signal transducer with metallopeptidase domain
MLAWMLYAVTVSLLVSFGAACAATSARLRGTPTRFIWAAAFTLSVLIPVIVSSVSITLPALSSGSADTSPHTVALRDLTPNFAAPASILGALPGSVRATSGLDDALGRIWAALSLLLAAAVIANACLVGWRKRSWGRTTVFGTPVLVAPESGPALAGLLFPKIVVPSWLLQEPAETQLHVIAHERAHLAARDTYLLAAAVGLLILMPWNVPLWWQIRRLRFALETDCDARVVAEGASPARYAEMLIGIGERRARRFAPSMPMAMAEPATNLEKRIRLMLENTPRRTWLASLSAAAAAVIVLAAASVTPPNAQAFPEIERLVGTYQMSPAAVLTITQQDGALFARLTGQSALRLAPKGPATFTAKAVGAEFDFVLPESGPAKSVTLHQHGQVIVMARIGEDEAQQIATATKVRASRDTPAPGSREALAHLIDGIISGTPDYSAMTPKFADVTREQLARLHDGVGGLGAVQSITFVRVGGQGQDIYLVKQKDGATMWQIAMAGGKIAGALVSVAP